PRWEGVGFHSNDQNDKPRRPSSSAPSCVAATTTRAATRATTATTRAIESRNDAGQHASHQQSTSWVPTHLTKDVRKVPQRGIVFQPCSCILRQGDSP